MLRRIALLLLVGGVAVATWRIVTDERDRSAGVIAGPARSSESLRASQRAIDGTAATLGHESREPAKHVLFGDLHVHSTFSIDAFAFALPVFGGEGAHPPADACDFARHCAGLDFFSINDHAEGLTTARWDESKESIRQCNARAGDPDDPDLVAFVGWEWTQTGDAPESHYGHRNVIFPGLADDELPTRPISALPDGTVNRARAMWLVRMLEQLGPIGLGDYADFLWLTRQIAQTPDCAQGVDVRDLPTDCRENASTPSALFAKLAQWGFEHMVIPHGLAWGVHAPPGASLDVALADGNHDPEVERLVEIFSGHGNSEEFRGALDAVQEKGVEGICSPPTPDFLPCCWRAGEIMRARCGDLPEAECERRVEEAKQLALDAGQTPHRVFPDTRVEDWLDCDQCRDCFKPAMNLRPRQTAQYSLAVARFDPARAKERSDDARPQRFRWGFIASTDNHAARPGTGYKQYDRRRMTDARGIDSAGADAITRPFILGRQQDPQRAQPGPAPKRSFQSLFDVERGASFMYPGGIVAVHAAGRDRRSIWNALTAREVYGTSGPRMLLWFDLVNGPDGRVPMGGEAALARTPEFEVRAAGAFIQNPGCPAESIAALAPDRLERLCRGECDHPGDVRHPIAAIEVVRVRPQQRPGEAVGELIEDPWLRHECAPDPGGCVFRFEDPEYVASARSAVYYVRALQQATPAINGDPLRTEFDAAGNAVRTDPCHGGHLTPASDDCLAPVRERAWSSPIYVDPPRGPAEPPNAD